MLESAVVERVVVLDNLSTGHRGALSPDAAFVEGDIHAVVRDAWDYDASGSQRI